MAFLYSISNSIVLSRTEYTIDLLPENLEEILVKSLIGKGYKYIDGGFVGTDSLFNISYRYELNLELFDDKIVIDTKIGFQSFVNGLLIINLLIAFFSKFKFESYLWFILVVDVVLYTLNFLIVKNVLNHTILRLFEGYKKEEIEF